MANQHVVPNGKNWQVKAEKATKATKNFNTQKAAIAYAKDICVSRSENPVQLRFSERDTQISFAYAIAAF